MSFLWKLCPGLQEEGRESVTNIISATVCCLFDFGCGQFRSRFQWKPCLVPNLSYSFLFSLHCLLASVKHQSTKVLPQKSVRSLWNHTWGHAIAWRHALPERVGLDCLLGFGNKMEIFVIQIFMYLKKGNRKKALKKFLKEEKIFWALHT